LTMVDPTAASVLLVKFTGGVVGMLPARAANGTSAAPRAAYFHNFKDAADDISKGSQNLRLLNQPGTALVRDVF
jgi:hypothetical protein